MQNNNFREIILENAIKHKGKADLKFVINSLLAKDASLKEQIKEISDSIKPIISEINSLSIDEQKKQMEQINPNFFEKKEKEERNIFAFLNIKSGDKIVTAFPPSPEKYYHIGHAKSIYLNYLLAKQYNGKFYLRFEDTNPINVKPEFYKIMLEDISWLGVEWDELQYASDYLDLFIEYAEKLIKNNQAYICFCDPDTLKKNRFQGIPCNCRNHTPEQNLKYWEEMKTSYPPEKASLRLKIDIHHKNTTMRDPIIFRVIDASHPRLEKKYRIYPTYDFQNAIMDGYFGITHRFRTKEFELRSELHHYIRKLLGLYDTYTYEFARFNLIGMESSGRKIREKVQSGELIGWDDPSLPTLRALKRRGFSPEAIKQLVIESGISKASGTKLTWDTLYKYNRRVLNDTAKRFFLIKEPVEIIIKNDPCRNIQLSLHPKLDLGKRNFSCTGKYLIEKSDFDNFKNGDLIRLIDNLNFICENGEYIYKNQEYLEYKNAQASSKAIIHFLPNDSSQLVDVTILMPDKQLIKGLAEKNIELLNIGDIVQFERWAFCRLDSIDVQNNKKIYNFWFTHL
ncbi:MAG TPA: glutamate--tRNA ligase [archaeon]|jgi:glutamyl-tRNA synthetase|nr:glutamate--tRNA ligase [archaeon]